MNLAYSFWSFTILLFFLCTRRTSTSHKTSKFVARTNTTTKRSTPIPKWRRQKEANRRELKNGEERNMVGEETKMELSGKRNKNDRRKRKNESGVRVGLW